MHEQNFTTYITLWVNCQWPTPKQNQIRRWSFYIKIK